MESAITDKLQQADRVAISVGTIVQINIRGQALVDFPGNLVGPVEARSVVSVPRPDEETIGRGIEVLLMFDDGNPSAPIIVGVVREELCPTETSSLRPLEPSISPTREVLVDGKKIVFDAKEEIHLLCGKSSIKLRKDGKIEVKGTELVSRSSGTNRIKGGSVAIN